MLLVTAIGAGFFWIVQKGTRPTYNPQVSFRDVERSQVITIDDFTSLRFSTSEGTKSSIAELSDARFTVLVITRGWSENLCLYCIAQTAQWAGKQQELKKLDSKLLLVFPVATHNDADKLELLHQRVKQDGADIDFPTLLDLDLESVNQLGIQAQLSKPATYIIDREGKVRFAYVGQSIADRPTVDSVISQLEILHGKRSP